MSEYYLADLRARERNRQQSRQNEPPAATQSQDEKVTLLGDFMIASGEPRGFDPYNNVQAKSPRDTWRTARGRR